MDFSSLMDFVVEVLSKAGYVGVVGLMAVESTCIPIVVPSELFLISYGAAAYKGDMNIFFVIIAAILGILVGSIINYYMALFLGRGFVYKYGKYFFLSIDKIKYWENLFLKYSKVIIFFGRFIPIPAVKHIVAIPAGFSKMNIKIFIALTTLGGAIFSSIVVSFGYWFGKKVESVENYSSFMNKFMFYSLLFVIAPIIIYKIYNRFFSNTKPISVI